MEFEAWNLAAGSSASGCHQLDQARSAHKAGTMDWRVRVEKAVGHRPIMDDAGKVGKPFFYYYLNFLVNPGKTEPLGIMHAKLCWWAKAKEILQSRATFFHMGWRPKGVSCSLLNLG